MRICKARTYGRILAAVAIGLLLLLVAWAMPFQLRVLPGGATRVEHVHEAIATINGRQELLTLPHTFRGLEPGTDIRLTFQVYEAEPFSMLVKGVYSPFTVTCDGARLSTYGEPGTYPAFLADPPTSLQVVNLPAVPYTEKLRTITVTYKMPQARASLPVAPFAVSNMAGVFRGEFRWLILGFLLECTLVLVGILLLLLAGLSRHVAHSQKMLLYLGLFFLAVGLWNVGENDFSIFVFRNPTFLYLLTFSGLFFIVAPLYGFALQAVTFRWHRLLTAVMYVSFTAATLALLLQFTGMYMLSQSLYVFHVLHCASLVLLTVALAFEAIHERNTHARWMLIPIACLLTTALLELANYHLFHWFDFSLGFLSGTILFLLLLLVLTAAIIRRNARIQEAYIAQQHQTELMGVRLDAEKTRHDMILQEEQRLARLRHDMKHHVALVAELAARGDLERIRHHMAELTDTLQTTTPQHYCENLAVNALVGHYAELARAAGCQLTIDIECPEHADGLTDAELAVVFGNLLENALESCRRAPSGTDTFIRIKARVLSGHLVIVQDNTITEPPRRKDAAFLSSKREGAQPGLGLRSIADLAAAHGGRAEFTYDTEAFHSSVILEL